MVLCSSVYRCAFKRYGGFYADLYVVGAAAYLECALIAAIDFAYVQVRSLYGFAFGNLADVNARNILAYINEFFNFETAGK